MVGCKKSSLFEYWWKEGQNCLDYTVRGKIGSTNDNEKIIDGKVFLLNQRELTSRFFRVYFNQL